MFGGRSGVIREQRRVRTNIVVLDERLGGNHGSFRVACAVLSSVRPMAFLVLSMAAALGRVPSLAAHAAVLLGTACFLLHLGAGARRTFLGSPHLGLWSMRRAVVTYPSRSAPDDPMGPFTKPKYTDAVVLPPYWICEMRPKRVTAVSLRSKHFRAYSARSNGSICAV